MREGRQYAFSLTPPPTLTSVRAASSLLFMEGRGQKDNKVLCLCVGHAGCLWNLITNEMGGVDVGDRWVAFPRLLLQLDCRRINNQLCRSLSPGISLRWLLLLPLDSSTPPPLPHPSAKTTPKRPPRLDFKRRSLEFNFTAWRLEMILLPSSAEGGGVTKLFKSPQCRMWGGARTDIRDTEFVLHLCVVRLKVRRISDLPLYLCTLSIPSSPPHLSPSGAGGGCLVITV